MHSHNSVSQLQRNQNQKWRADPKTREFLSVLLLGSLSEGPLQSELLIIYTMIYIT